MYFSVKFKNILIKCFEMKCQYNLNMSFANSKKIMKKNVDPFEFKGHRKHIFRAVFSL